MKTKRILITVLAVAIVSMASATDLSKMMVNPLNANQLIVSVVNDKVSNFEISVYAKNGDMVYFKQSDKPIFSYQKIIDVQNLEKGGEHDAFLPLFQAPSSQGTLDDELVGAPEKEVVQEHAGKQDGKDLKFSYLNFKNEKFKLEIYDENELIFKTNIGNNFSIHSGYNLSKLEAGNYKAVLTSYDKRYTYQFEK